MNNNDFKIKTFPRNTSKEEFVKDLRRVAFEIERETVTCEEYDERGNFSSSTIRRKFKGWLIALKAAGLKESRVIGLSDEDYFQNIEEVSRRLGAQPTYSEMVKPFSRYCVGAYEKRYGSWYKALDAKKTWYPETVKRILASAD